MYKISDKSFKINSVVMYKVLNEFLIPYYTLLLNPHKPKWLRNYATFFARAQKISVARAQKFLRALAQRATFFARAQQDFLRAREVCARAVTPLDFLGFFEIFDLWMIFRFFAQNRLKMALDASKSFSGPQTHSKYIG